ncbi:MAG TPA: 3'-5' exonuclease [Bacteroidetes bacterium]|nr:3'-5' exonuclease [Bacteroidota bacterium]
MFLFFDTETTGLPRNWNAPASDTRNWPRMVQLGCLLYDGNGQLKESRNYIIKPDGYTIPPGASAIHGITTERAIKEGKELSGVLDDFKKLIAQAGQLVAHNMAFDEKIIGAEYYRISGHDPLSGKPKICTMKDPNVIAYCALPPFRYGKYKWPKLSELYYKLFGNYFDEAHDASVDIKATAESFWELRKRGVI